MFNSQDLRAQVVQERDSARHLSLQKELELKELQARLEKKVKYFSFALFLFYGSPWGLGTRICENPRGSCRGADQPEAFGGEGRRSYQATKGQ